ncbi:peptidylprolyl isomerase [Candidatus Poribacteria bacterium]
MIRCIRFTGLIFIITLLVIGSANVLESEEPKEPAAAVVNGKRILMSSLDGRVQGAIGQNPELREKENIAELRKMRRDILSELIDQELVIQEGEKAGLKPRDIEIDTELAKIKQQFPSEESFQQLLKQRKLTAEKLHKIIERALIGKKVLDVKVKPTAKPVTDEDISAFYAENKKQFVKQEQVKASHILIKVAPDADDQAKSDAKSEIQAILEKARGGEDFAELAKEYSQGPSAPSGGDLGYFTRGRMVKPFEDAAFSLEMGQISEVVETQFGYHIILNVDRKPEIQIALEEVSEGIRKGLDDKEVDIALKKWLEPVREKATIEILFKG